MRRLLLLSLAVLLVIGALSGGARAETAGQSEIALPPVFSHLTPADGLPYPVALGIAQDRHGFLWAATPGGAARWDGYRMTVFHHDSNVPQSLPENIVTSVLGANDGQLWFGTTSGLIVHYDESSQGFSAYRDEGGMGTGRPNAIASDGRGGIWVASRRGLSHLDGPTRIWRRETSIPAGDVGGVMVDRSGGVWAGTSGGIMWRRGEGEAFTPLKMPAEIKKDIASAIFEGSDGTVWFGTRRGRVGSVAPNGQVVLEPALSASGHRVTAIIEPKPGLLWIGQYGGGIHELRQKSRSVRSFVHDPAISTSLSDNSVTGLLVDRSGLVWVSTLRGIDRHVLGNDHILTLVSDTRGGLPGPDVRSVTATPDGRMWLGLRAEGLALVDQTAHIIRTLPSGPLPDNLPPSTNQAVADSADGMVWVGQFGGLFQVNAASGKARRYEPLTGFNILTLLKEGRHLWAGGSMGLARISLDSTAPPRVFGFERHNPNSLSDDSAHALFRDSSQRLWVGTWNGLNLLEDEEKGHFRRFVNDPGDQESLPSNVINGICEDQLGRIWLATANGIGIFDPRQPGKARFTRLGRSNGLPSDTVLSVIAADGGRIVAGTGDGLTLIDQQSLTVRTLGPADGMHVRTFWAGSAARMSDGTLGLGGFGGLAMIRPGSLPVWQFRPPIVVTALRVGGQARPEANSIVVSPEDGGFQVDFSALDFSAPESNRYAYRLAGNDGDWIFMDSRHRTAGYTHLSPGIYRLELRGSNSAGVWSDPPKSIDVHVLPAWYQTLWFRLLAAAILIAVVVGAEQLRKRRHLRREQYLTSQIAAKTAEAEAAKMRALAGEEEACRAKDAAEAAVRLKSRFLAIIGHEIRTPLNGLLGMLQVLDPRGFRGTQREILVTAKQAGETLRDLVENVLEYGRVDAKDAEIVLKDTELCRLAAETLELLRRQAAEKGIDLCLRITPEGPIWVLCDPIRLSRILVNLLGNAVKFTDQGEVVLDVTARPENNQLRLVIVVSDTGIGIAPDIREAIFGDFVQADDTITRRFGGAGLGLAISRRMAAQMNGELSLESTVGKGSRFCLTLLADAGNAPPAADERRVLSSDHLRVMVVDDDMLNRRVAKSLLAHLGHESIEATGGEHALSILSADDAVDAILMDIRMPRMDGIEATRRIRQLERERQSQSRIRIVAMTADLTDETWQRCVAAGMDCGISKPAQLDRLRQALSMDAMGEAHTGMRQRPAAPEWLDLEFVRVQLDILGYREMIRLVRLFRQVSGDLIMGIEAAAKHLDRPDIEASAHRLRSAAGSLGLVGMADMARRLEADAAKALPEHIRGQVSLLCEARRALLKGWARTVRQII